MSRILLIVLTLLLTAHTLLTDPEPNTVGLLYIDQSQVAPGYNLVYPHNQPDVFLFDQCGQIVHSWTDTADYRPGNTAYILPNGDLVKTKRHNNSINDPIWAGGGGAIVEIRDWDNALKARYELNNTEYRLHHDIAPMPNGNVLMVLWEKKDRAEAIAAGRDSTLLPAGELWSEAVFEWDPRKDSIVWEWRLWDHLIAEDDADKSGAGNVAEHPELVHINYDEHDGHQDWLHLNAIDYNPVLDQIVLSIPYFNEFWIIDHSTTTKEAATATGGRAGRGGDLLYRWGNPAAYDQGDASDKQLYFQHDVHWAKPEAQPGDPAFGRIMAFNNQAPNDRSPVYVINTGVDPQTGNYPFANGKFGPAGPEQIYQHPTADPRATSESVSSSQLMPNGNILVMAGRWGYAYEMNPAGALVWEYIIPLKAGSPVSQGEALTINNNLTFRLNRYPLDYSGFDGHDLSPLGYWELDPNISFCEQPLRAGDLTRLPDDLLVYPNPARNLLTISREKALPAEAVIYDLTGRMVSRLLLQENNATINCEQLSPGVYSLVVRGSRPKRLVITK